MQHNVNVKQKIKKNNLKKNPEDENKRKRKLKKHTLRQKIIFITIILRGMLQRVYVLQMCNCLL